MSDPNPFTSQESPEGPPPVPQSESQTSPMAVSSDERTMAMFAHLAILIGHVIPFANLVIPIVLLCTKGKESIFIANACKESLNFQIVLFIAYVICAILILVVIGLLLLPVIALATVVFSIIAGIKANDGIDYRYPYIFRLIT